MSIREECGIAAVVLKRELNNHPTGGAAHFLENMLYQLQHRGQESAGISTFNSEKNIRLKRHIGVGKVDEVFRVRDRRAHEKILEYNSGTIGIGHVRYSTSGRSIEYGDLLAEAQPFLRQHGKRWKKFAIAFNGNLANYKELAQDLSEDYDYDLETNVDTEVIMHFLSIDIKTLEEKTKVQPNLEDVLTENHRRYDGAYNVVFLDGEGKLLVFRDPLGIRPLVYGENDDFFAVASESNALRVLNINGNQVKPVEPGNGILVKDGKIKNFKFANQEKKTPCVFEPTYFMWDSSIYDVFDGKPITVNTIRRRLGIELAENESLKDHFLSNKETVRVVPVPNTSIPAAEAYAGHLGIPYVQAIRKKEYGITGDRGFIHKPDLRHLIMDNKYDIIRELVEDMILIVVDDSVVRGDTSARLVNLLREYGGAREVHLRSTFPPIKYPCFYGIDFPTLDELIAAPFDSTEDSERYLAEVSGLDSMGYQRISGLVNALMKTENCLACLNGKYPTEFGRKRFEEALNASKIS